MVGCDTSCVLMPYILTPIHVMIGRWGSPKVGGARGRAAPGEEKIPYLRHKERLDNTGEQVSIVLISW